MQYVHVRNIEKYHPGYKDRTLLWAKIGICMAEGDPDFEMIENEIDKWRFICFVLLELRAKKPLPITDDYFRRKGFDLKKRPIILTIQMLHNFLEIVHSDVEMSTKDHLLSSNLNTSNTTDLNIETLNTKIDDLSWPISYLNQLLGTRYSTKGANIAFVKARYSEGRTQEDFKTVIDKKVTQWRSDEKMSKYLRPETLFNGTKFESYLNEPVSITEKSSELRELERMLKDV